MDYQPILAAIEIEVQEDFNKGHVADYIPALAAINPNQFALSLLLNDCVVQKNDNALYQTGLANKKFSIQSISKVLTLAMIMSVIEDEQIIWDRLGKEPSGMAFNSLIQLELESGVPRNPLINAGAIVVADLLTSHFEHPLSSLKDFVTGLVGHDVTFDGVVATSEKQTGHRNLSLAYLMKSFGNIHNDVNDVLDVYFNQCALYMSTNELVQAFSFLANDGVNPLTNQVVVTEKQCRRINALMLTCGTYDRAGQFAFDVGLPAKSGVGGGIVAVIPDQGVVSVWSPALGSSGNSVAGMHALEIFVQKTDMGVF